MQITIDETKLQDHGLDLTETDVIDTLRRALSTVVLADSGGRQCRDEKALLDAIPDPDAHEPRAVTDADLAEWVAKVHEMRETHRLAKFPNLDPDSLTIERGRKYARIVTNGTGNRGGNRSVYCFVRLDNGDILKAATWKAPAKYARGNIFAADPLAGVGEYGAEYLR